MKLSVIALGAIVLAPVADAAQTRRQNCPSVHIFGARETTAPPGFGSASTVVNLIQRANNGATSEPIIYPAAGGNAYAASGFAARPVGFQCRAFESIIQAYCDAEDPFCANGNSTATHQGYGREYGEEALRFVQSRLRGSSGNVFNETTTFAANKGSPLELNGKYIWTLLASIGMALL
ncbi:hypothetical protein GGS26DRAFT_334419 [Hypomontagnella submonticulosa]|nr:hypothetical protein GGS26DRAFT_334419 [Hypomontagnella submonticulosa]